MPVSLKYAVVERERRFLVARLPDGVSATRDVVDHYLAGTRLRLREVRDEDGTVVRKLGHKVRLGEGPAEVACTNLYLDDAEWALLGDLPGSRVHKRRHVFERDGLVVVVDEHDDGTLVAEIDDGDGPPRPVPDWLEVTADVSADEAWTGAGRAERASGTESLTAALVVPAAPEAVFAVLADPGTHVAVARGRTGSDRTGRITAAVDAEPLTAPGQVFRMAMYHPDHPDGDYRTANQVRELDPPHRIAWATGTEDEQGRLSFGGWVWRYDLAPTADGATEVRLTYDWSAATEAARAVIGFPPFGVEHLQDSLDRLADVVARAERRPGPD